MSRRITPLMEEGGGEAAMKPGWRRGEGWCPGVASDAWGESEKRAERIKNIRRGETRRGSFRRLGLSGSKLYVKKNLEKTKLEKYRLGMGGDPRTRCERKIPSKPFNSNKKSTSNKAARYPNQCRRGTNTPGMKKFKKKLKKHCLTSPNRN